MSYDSKENNKSLQRRHNERDVVSNHQPHDCLLKRLFWRRSKKTSKLRVTGLCVGNSPVTGEFLAQRASNAENISIIATHLHIHESVNQTFSWKVSFKIIHDDYKFFIHYLTVINKNQCHISFIMMVNLHHYFIISPQHVECWKTTNHKEETKYGLKLYRYQEIHTAIGG